MNAIMRGANGICVNVNGGNTSPSLESVAEIIRRKGDDCGICASINITQLQRAMQQLKLLLTHAPANGITPTADYSHMELDADCDMATVNAAVRELGYDLAEEDLSKVYASVCDVAKQKTVGAKELDAIIASVALQVPPTYILDSYVINSGSAISATACIKMEKDGEALSGVCCGHGPIDAAFAAIGAILGCHYELDDFQIQSVTEGSEAMGSALVRLRANGKLYSGSGISTDIVGASIKAYINAINKIAYEENA
jgi:2-isopropylmalate synthase